MGQKIFEENSAVRQRMIEYGKIFDELHLVVFTPDLDKFENQTLSRNVFLYPSKSKVRVFYVFDFIKIIRKILKNSGKDNVVLTCQDPFETGIVGAMVKLFFGLPLHIQIHTDLAHKYFKGSSLLNKIRFIMSEFTLRYSDRVRVVSERIKKSIETFSKNIDVLPIYTKLQCSYDRKKSVISENLNSLNILTVCRLEKEKNLEIAAKAFKRVLDLGVLANFTIVGDGGERKNLENLCRELGIEKKVIFAGWQNNLEKYYEESDIYISTSLYEGYGMSMVEAGTYGLPLVISNTGVAGEVFKDGEEAFVCDAKDLNCFTQSILKIYRDKNLAQKMGQSARESAYRHLQSEKDYFKNYADSITKTVVGFKKINFISRIFNFKKTAFNSFMALRYFICGITAAATNIISIYIFTDVFDIWYLYSSIIAFLVSLLISFILQKFVVFKDIETRNIHQQFSKFFIVAILGVITNTILISLCVEIFGIWYVFSQIIAGFFVMIQNFISYKFFIFNKS